MEPLKYIDAEGNVLLEEENTHGGSLRYPQKLFNCPICFKTYFDPNFCKKHFLKCKLNFEDDIVYEKDNLKILKLTTSLNKKTIKACSELAYFSKREQEVDIVLINPKESFNEENPVFCLVKNNKLIGYFAYWKQIFSDKEKKSDAWILWDIYILKHERRKGYAILLFNVSLEKLNIKLQDLFYSCPITKDALEFLKSKGISKLNYKGQDGWCRDVPIDNCVKMF